MISVDFIIELPKSVGFDTVMTVVDSVSKMAHFILTYTTVSIERAARLFLHHVWKLYGLSTCIVSDCELQFIALFMKELYLLRIKVSTSNMPTISGARCY